MNSSCFSQRNRWIASAVVIAWPIQEHRMAPVLLITLAPSTEHGEYSAGSAISVAGVGVGAGVGFGVGVGAGLLFVEADLTATPLLQTSFLPFFSQV